MSTGTKSKAAKAEVEPVATLAPISFDEIARKRLAGWITAYRELVHRHAAGEMLNEAELEKAAELLDHLGLPAFAFDRDAAAVQSHDRAKAKWQSAVDRVPECQSRSEELAIEIAALRAKVAQLSEEARKATAGIGKPSAYLATLAQLAHDHPHVLADVDEAVAHRKEELDRRRRIGGAV